MPSYDLVPRNWQIDSLSQSAYVLWVELTEGKGGGEAGEEQNYTMARKPGPL